MLVFVDGFVVKRVCMLVRLFVSYFCFLLGIEVECRICMMILRVLLLFVVWLFVLSDLYCCFEDFRVWFLGLNSSWSHRFWFLFDALD